MKRLWDSDAVGKVPLKVALLGSAPLLIQRGLTESLAGRFEVVPVVHWSYAEMKDSFGFGLDQYVYYGGYPGAAELIGDRQRWSRYIIDSLIETTISRDILLMTRVDKPALLRRHVDRPAETGRAASSAADLPYLRIARKYSFGQKGCFTLLQRSC